MDFLWGRFKNTLSAAGWERLPKSPEIIGLLLVLVFMSYKMIDVGWIPLLDWATLIIHEAGHPLVGVVFGENMMVYGGSMFQLLFPLIFAWHFARLNQASGYCFSIAWEASSLHNLGRYVSDARAQELPLVGNGDRLHDWHEILGRWNMLNYDTVFGDLLSAMCWILMGCCFLMLWNWWNAPIVETRNLD